MHKSGFVNIIGNPNVGKSTLMNELVGERLSIITSKAQTTRHRIMGIVNGDDFQIVYSDTPGILKPAYKLQESMMHFVSDALSDADVILYVTDTVERGDETSEAIVATLARGTTPVIVVINKIDLTTQEQLEELVGRWHDRLPSAAVVPVSALNRFNMEGLLDAIVARLPEGEPYYPKDTLTDRPLRFFASEIIREKILLNYQKEIPYSVEIAIEEYREEPTIDRIAATIYVARESQKAILIGRRGEMLKKVGTAARIDLEKFLDKKVFLQLFVKVSDNWRDSDKQLRRSGSREESWVVAAGEGGPPGGGMEGEKTSSPRTNLWVCAGTVCFGGGCSRAACRFRFGTAAWSAQRPGRSARCALCPSCRELPLRIMALIKNDARPPKGTCVVALVEGERRRCAPSPQRAWLTCFRSAPFSSDVWRASAEPASRGRSRNRPRRPSPR